MFVMDYSHEHWNSSRIIPYGAIEIFPANCTLHYGQAVFEGLKAFHSKDGKINIFRPERHHSRMNKSSYRLCIPEMPYEYFINGLSSLINIDKEWVPARKGYALYIRPFIFATDNFIGIKISDTYKFMIISSPVAKYYSGEVSAISLTTSDKFVRAAKGGLGEAKTPANYAASLLPVKEARRDGFTQVLWLDATEQKYIDEVGTTNIFFLIGDELITPQLEGSILEGVTRDSVITIAREWGIKVTEKRISIDEIIQASEENKLKEVFATGTAAVLIPVGRIRHNDKELIINEGKMGTFSQKLFDEITGIQYGELEDKYNWIYKLG